MPEAARKPYAEQCTRVYTRTGTRAHLMSPVQSIRNGSVLCDRVLPEWFTEWHGTGSQDEIDRAASLQLCKPCEDQARREDEYYSEPSQFTPRTRAASPPAARGSASDADHAGVPIPPSGAPAKTSRQVQAPKLPGPDGTPGPETARPGPAAVRARAKTPAGASGTDSPPAGSSDEELRTAQRDAWKRAQGGHNHRQRAGRVRRAARQAGPGMIRRPPPPGTPGDVA